MPLIHQRHTGNNNPFHILTDNDNDDDTVIKSNCSPSIPPTVSPSSAPPLNPSTCQLTSPPSIPPPSAPPMSLPTTPPPRVQATRAFIPAITPTAPYSSIHDLHLVPLQKPIQPLSYTKQQAHSLPVVEPDDEQDSTPTSNKTPCNISRQALYHIINLRFTHAPATAISCKLIHDQYTGAEQ
jgi:hypothetical protein